jgi:hypothetical protein
LGPSEEGILANTSTNSTSRAQHVLMTMPVPGARIHSCTSPCCLRHGGSPSTTPRRSRTSRRPARASTAGVVAAVVPTPSSSQLSASATGRAGVGWMKDEVGSRRSTCPGSAHPTLYEAAR